MLVLRSRRKTHGANVCDEIGYNGCHLCTTAALDIPMENRRDNGTRSLSTSSTPRSFKCVRCSLKKKIGVGFCNSISRPSHPFSFSWYTVRLLNQYTRLRNLFFWEAWHSIQLQNPMFCYTIEIRHFLRGIHGAKLRS